MTRWRMAMKATKISFCNTSRSERVHGPAFAGVWNKSQYPSIPGGMIWDEEGFIGGQLSW